MKKVNKLATSARNNPVLFLVLTIFLFVGIFFRVYKPSLMAFNYDQGRDALVIWQLWHEGKFFLIGPVTGLAGIFLGPLYYYLIAPFYLLGQGNPVYPYYFIISLTIVATSFCYYVGKKMHSTLAGVLAFVIASSSAYIVQSSRWLSNPTPLLLTSVLLLFSLWKIMESKKGIWWVASALLIGISLQFEAASAVFYLPMFAIFTFWQRKKLPNIKLTAISIAVFLLTLVPQIVFNFRHDNILLTNFLALFLHGKSFSISFIYSIPAKLSYFWTVFSSKIFVGNDEAAIVFFAMAFAFLLAARKRLNKDGLLTLFAIFILTPVVGIFLFEGNYGNLYDYYMTGIYLPFIILFSIGLVELFRRRFGEIVVFVFVAMFLFNNIGALIKSFGVYAKDPNRVSLGNELLAVNWVFDDAKGRGEFNVDEYVPPVIPYTYDYLFLWRGTKRCNESLCGLKMNENKGLLYTLYEVDPQHPDRINAWFERQKGIGRVIEETRFNGIGVQRRERL